MPDIIPDVNKEMNELITNTISSVDPTSKLSPVLDSEKNVLYYKDSMGRRVDKDKFRKVLEGESIGALGGYESRELKSLFNNVLKQKGDNEFSYEGPLTKDQEKLINTRFVDYMMNQGSVKKILGNIVEETITSGNSDGKTIIKDFEKGVKNASKNITTSKGVTYSLNGNVFMGNGKTPNPSAKYIYTPKGDGDSSGTPIEVNYWKKVPGKTVTDRPTYKINLQEILDTFGSKFRKL